MAIRTNRIVFFFLIIISLFFSGQLTFAKEFNLVKNIRVDGLLEVEGSYQKNYSQVITTDFYLRKFEPKILIGMNKNLSGEVDFLYEPETNQNSQTLLLDQGFLTYGDLASREVNEPDSSEGYKVPYFVNAGKKVLPFGLFKTFFVSYPLTRDFARTREHAIEIGLRKWGLEALFYGFRGVKKKEGSDGRIREFGGKISYNSQYAGLKYSMGLGYITSIAETLLLQDKVGGSNMAQFKSKVPGLFYFINFDINHFHLNYEYVGATKNFLLSDFAFNGRGARPESFTIELGYDFSIFDESFLAAVGYQKTEELLGGNLPLDKVLVALSYNLYTNSKITLEIFDQRDYHRNDSSSGQLGTGSSASGGKLNWQATF